MDPQVLVPGHQRRATLKGVISSAEANSQILAGVCRSPISKHVSACASLASASSDCYFLMGLDPGAERSLRELSILFADVAKFY